MQGNGADVSVSTHGGRKPSLRESIQSGTYECGVLQAQGHKLFRRDGQTEVHLHFYGCNVLEADMSQEEMKTLFLGNVIRR